MISRIDTLDYCAYYNAYFGIIFKQALMKNLSLIIFSLFITSLSGHALAKPQSDHPASITELTITSEGHRMSGLIYGAAGRGLHPTILLLHGYPGNEKNLDVAQAMRSKGWNVVFFHYRGAWGSEGEFSFLNAEQDVQVVLDYLKTNAKKLNIDKQQISLVGHSMGGHMAIAGILNNPTVKCAVSYDGANLGANSASATNQKKGGLLSDEKTAKMWLDYTETLFMLNGWSAEKFKQEINNHSEKLDLVSRASKINGRPVLLIAANTSVIPHDIHITPLLNALKATKNSNISYQLIEDDHSFSSSRDKLITVTANFLNAACKN